MSAADAVTGKGIPRVDGRLKVTGRADYAAEVAVANVAHAVIVTSTITKGRIASIDTEAATGAPGVLSVLTPANALKLPGVAKRSGSIDRVLQVLQDNEVTYNDQPVALVVADTLEHAQYAASLVVPRYEDAAQTVDFVAEMPRAYAPATGGPAGKPDSRRGDDVDAALASAKTKVVQTYTTPVENHNPMEMHGTIAVWQGDDHLTVYDATQGIFGVRARLAAVFYGGMVWGIGLALLEHTVRDGRSGRVTTRDLADYHVPVNADVPPIDVIMIPEDDPHVNEIGAKGIGDIGITGMAAAIANAVYHATGRRVRDLPITLDKLI